MASVSLWTSFTPYLRATINWGDGSSTNIQQEPLTYTVNGTQYTNYLPAYSDYPGISVPQQGFITNITTPNTTFNGYNQNLNVKNLALGGIASFDTDLTNLNSLTDLTLGGYYSTLNTGSGQPTIGPLINDPIEISSFTTIMPVTTNNHNVSFLNNTIDCSTFTPTWNNKSVSFTFSNNQQTTPLVIDNTQRFATVNIRSNPQLTQVTLNGMVYLDGVCNLDNNSLTSVYINGLSTNLTTGTLTINLNDNKFEGFNPAFIPSFPSAKTTSINLSSNLIQPFDCFFNGTNMDLLNLSSQIPINSQLRNITDNSVKSSYFKRFRFENNNITQCPILPTTMTHLYLDSNPIIATGKNAQGEFIRPNLSPIMQVFSLRITGGGQYADLSLWEPNSASPPTGNQHTPLQNITTWTLFDMTSQNLETWIHQFSNNITSTISRLNLTRNRLITLDMSLVGGFSIIELSFQNLGNSLTSITNLTSVTKLRELDISVNFLLTSSTSIIPDADPWPASLYKINLNRCTGLVSWTKSLQGFNSAGYSNLNINFNGTNLNSTSINFIINNLIKNTTLTNGNLFFSSNQGGNIYNYPKLLVSQFGPDTAACLNCLTTPTSTPCTPTLSSGTNLTGMGRGFTVTLLTA
jgi:hypothetical protein